MKAQEKWLFNQYERANLAARTWFIDHMGTPKSHADDLEVGALLKIEREAKAAYLAERDKKRK